mgnify:CR=1 FL=1
MHRTNHRSPLRLGPVATPTEVTPPRPTHTATVHVMAKPALSAVHHPLDPGALIRPPRRWLMPLCRVPRPEVGRTVAQPPAVAGEWRFAIARAVCLAAHRVHMVPTAALTAATHGGKRGETVDGRMVPCGVGTGCAAVAVQGLHTATLPHHPSPSIAGLITPGKAAGVRCPLLPPPRASTPRLRMDRP